ncbi:hypothetical protein WJX81_002411 [Elliptochloris bilobata]|uniref:Major facilitator superfamily (MFS) profile domain-containing protein n=1 Tax=Elliptochloris bilobata TaxID=381761 RepID=A0AAW1RWU1_9CHLO
MKSELREGQEAGSRSNVDACEGDYDGFEQILLDGRDDPELPLLGAGAVSSPGSHGSAHLEVEGQPLEVHAMSLAERVYTVVIFTLTACMLYADQNLMAPNLTAIARDFGFNDQQRDTYLGGYIAAAFFAMGAPSALVIGYLSDRVNRRHLLFSIVLLGEGPCLATFFVTRYWQLLLLRMLTSISIGGALPLVCSLAGDLFFVRQRPGVLACVQVATACGLVLGQAVAGFVGSAWGWRWPFVLVALPALGVAAIMLVTTREPPRGGTEAALSKAYASGEFQYAERISLRKAAALGRTRSNLAVVLQGLPGSLPWGVLITFLNDFLSQQKGLTVPQATVVVIVAGSGGAVGVLGGGFLGQQLHAVWRPAMPLFTGACVMAASFPVWAIINSRLYGAGAMPAFMALGFAGAMLASPPGPNARGIILNVNEPEVRGVAMAMQTVLDDLGKGLGLYVLALMISAWGRETAFNVAIAGWLPCGLIFACAALTLGRDEDAMQERLRRRVAGTPGVAPLADAPGGWSLVTV